MTIRTIMMTCGYAEDASVSTLIFYSRFADGFLSDKKAVTSLALDMYAKFKLEHVREKSLSKSCCLAAKQNLANNFCPICGQNIITGVFDELSFMAMIRDFHNKTCSSYGVDDYAEARDFEWSPFTPDYDIFENHGKDVLRINHSGEGVVLLALAGVIPDIRQDRIPQSATLEWNRIRRNSK